jgi:mannonate dehydratase
MILTDLLNPRYDISWDYAVQAGISHGVIRLPEDEDFSLTDFSHWKNLYDRFQAHGITPLVLEPMPNRIHEHIKRGDDLRDAGIDQVIRFLPIMARLNIRIICMNFMAYTGWFRSRTNIPERGGALVSGFHEDDVPDKEPLRITQAELWDNLLYFLKAVVPWAEKNGVALALHPDDPPVERLGDVERILTSPGAIERAINLVPSDMVGVTLCQGCYAAMGEDVCRIIRDFSGKKKLFFVHFRDIRGSRGDFHETFHDNGQTDMVRVVKTYADCGFSGPVRVDHVPTMAGEPNDSPGYARIGRLYAIGYLKGIIDAVKGSP